MKRDEVCCEHESALSTDHQASELDALTARWDEGYANLWFVVLAVSLVAGVTFDLPWLRGLVVSCTFMSLPIAFLASMILNNNRATKVRVSPSGLTLESAAGEFYITWEDISNTQFREIGTYLLIETRQGKFKLGAELSDFTVLVQQITSRIEVARLPALHKLNIPVQAPHGAINKRFYRDGRMARDSMIWSWSLLVAATLLPMSLFCAATANTFIALGGKAMSLAATHVSHIASVFGWGASLTLAANALLSPAHIAIARRIWYIDVDANGLTLQRWLGKKRITWEKIDEIIDDETHGIVRAVVVDGKRVGIPDCINSGDLARVIHQHVTEPAAAQGGLLVTSPPDTLSDSR